MAGGNNSDGGRAAGRKRRVPENGSLLAETAAVFEGVAKKNQGNAAARSPTRGAHEAVLDGAVGKNPTKAELLYLATDADGANLSDPPAIGHVGYGGKRARAEALVDFLGDKAADYGATAFVAGNNPRFLQKFSEDKGTNVVHNGLGARVEPRAIATTNKGEGHDRLGTATELLATTSIDKVQGEVRGSVETRAELLATYSFEHARAVFENWLRTSQNASDATVQSALRCTIGQELRRMPMPTGVRFPKKGATGKNYRHLFYKQVARILGWVEKRGEGSERGFSDELYKVVREILYPDTVRDDETGRATEWKESTNGSRAGGAGEA